MLKEETCKKLKSTISFEETLERFNKKKSKDLTVNDLQHETRNDWFKKWV